MLVETTSQRQRTDVLSGKGTEPHASLTSIAYSINGLEAQKRKRKRKIRHGGLRESHYLDASRGIETNDQGRRLTRGRTWPITRSPRCPRPQLQCGCEMRQTSAPPESKPSPYRERCPGWSAGDDELHADPIALLSREHGGESRRADVRSVEAAAACPPEHDLRKTATCKLESVSRKCEMTCCTTRVMRRNAPPLVPSREKAQAHRTKQA